MGLSEECALKEDYCYIVRLLYCFISQLFDYFDGCGRFRSLLHSKESFLNFLNFIQLFVFLFETNDQK